MEGRKKCNSKKKEDDRGCDQIKLKQVAVLAANKSFKKTKSGSVALINKEYSLVIKVSILGERMLEVWIEHSFSRNCGCGLSELLRA